MRKICDMLSALWLSLAPIGAQETSKTVIIKTNVGTMKAILYDDVPNHTRVFVERVRRGDFNGTLFTRVIPEFMIQGGAPDSRNAPAGARCGFGDRSAEIMPEFNEKYFHKRGALAAPRQPDDVNPQKKSDMSQFFIVQGKVYRGGELDTLERTTNYAARQKALKEFYVPVRAELNMIKMSNRRESGWGIYDFRRADRGLRRAGPDSHPAPRRVRPPEERHPHRKRNHRIEIKTIC